MLVYSRLLERRLEIAQLAPLLGKLFGHGSDLGAHLRRVLTTLLALSSTKSLASLSSSQLFGSGTVGAAFKASFLLGCRLFGRIAVHVADLITFLPGKGEAHRWLSADASPRAPRIAAVQNCSSELQFQNCSSGHAHRTTLGTLVQVAAPQAHMPGLAAGSAWPTSSRPRAAAVAA